MNNNTPNGAILPALPSPSDSTPNSTTAEGESGGSEVQTLSVNGAPLALDALGPMVVNRDGTLARIANWGEMSVYEREATVRVLGRRNRERLRELRGSDNIGGGGDGDGNGNGVS